MKAQDLYPPNYDDEIGPLELGAKWWMERCKELQTRLGEAEERVKFLDAAVDAAIADRDYYTQKLEKAEARVKELESAIYAHGEQVLTGGDYVNPKTTLGNMVSMIVALREKVEDLEEQLAYRENKWTEKQP